MNKFTSTSLIVLMLVLAACSTNPTPINIPASTNAPISTSVPTIAAPAASVNAPTTAANTAVAPTAAAVNVKLKLNLNEATSEQLLTVPNVGNQMLREFLEYRPYVSIQQFRKELGKYIKADQIAEYEKYVYVPVNVNKADAETLKQLPGVTDAIAADLIAGRTYASNDAFLAKLETKISAENLAIAKNYLSK